MVVTGVLLPWNRTKLVSLNSLLDFLVGRHSQCPAVRLSRFGKQHCLCTKVRINSLLDFLDDLNLSLRQDRDHDLHC